MKALIYIVIIIMVFASAACESGVNYVVGSSVDRSNDTAYYQPGLVFETKDEILISDMEDVYLSKDGQLKKVYDGSGFLISVLYQSGLLFLDTFGEGAIDVIRIDDEAHISFCNDEGAYLQFAANGYVFYRINDAIYIFEISSSDNNMVLDTAPPHIMMLGYWDSYIYYRNESSVWRVSVEGKKEKLFDGNCFEMGRKGVLVYSNDGKMYKYDIDKNESTYLEDGSTEINYLEEGGADVHNSIIYLGGYKHYEYYATRNSNNLNLFCITKDVDENPIKKSLGIECSEAMLDEKSGTIYYVTTGTRYLKSYSVEKQSIESIEQMPLTDVFALPALTFSNDNIYYVDETSTGIHSYNLDSRETVVVFDGPIKCENILP